jgi:hypothetical protein
MKLLDVRRNSKTTMVNGTSNYKLPHQDQVGHQQLF